MEFILPKGLPDNNYGTKEKEMVIENNVWIYFNAAILKGVRIGKGAIIGASVIATKDVPNSIVVGYTAKTIKQ